MEKISFREGRKIEIWIFPILLGLLLLGKHKITMKWKVNTCKIMTKISFIVCALNFHKFTRARRPMESGLPNICQVKRAIMMIFRKFVSVLK